MLLVESATQFVGRRVLASEGNSKQPIDRLRNRVVRDVRSWGKHFLLDFGSFWVRVHFGLFGSWRVDVDDDPRKPRLRLQFTKGQALAFYACSVQLFEGSLADNYEWSADVMNPVWDAKGARAKLRTMPNHWLPMCFSTKRCSPGLATSSRTKSSIASAFILQAR